MYLDSKSQVYGKQLSPITLTAFYEKKIGNTIPKAVITNADQTVELASMSYTQLKNKKKYEEVEKGIKQKLKDPVKVTEIPKTPLKWSTKVHDLSLKFIRKADADTVVLQGSGKPKSYKLSDLSEGSVAYLTVMNPPIVSEPTAEEKASGGGEGQEKKKGKKGKKKKKDKKKKDEPAEEQKDDAETKDDTPEKPKKKKGKKKKKKDQPEPAEENKEEKE